MADVVATSTPLSATASQRRKSGRAVRAPEKFVPTPTQSQSKIAGKRKRSDTNTDGVGDEDEDDEQEEIEEEDEDEDEDEIEDNSEVEEEPVKRKSKKAATKKAPAAKKAKTNGIAPQAPKEPKAPKEIRLPTRSKKAAQGKVVFKDKEAEGVYAEIFTSGKPTDDVATQWLAQYEGDSTAAMKDLVICVLKCAGCDIPVTDDDINDPDNISNRLADIQEAHTDHTTAEYPLVAKSKSANAHAFKDTLASFFESLIRVTRETGVLYEDVAFIENLIAWITTMSSSGLRPFRHTATVIALACTTGLCEAVKDQMESTANTTKLLEKENGLKKPNEGRIKAFEKKIEQGKERRETSEATITEFINTVFVHRYRDLDPRIRNDCMEALGDWILVLPSVFYDGSYLRYLGWELSDPVGHVRHETLVQLNKIVKRAELGGVSNFIDRFRPRMIEMATLDADTTCRAAAVELLHTIREKGMLEPDDIDVVGKLIFDSDSRVRKAVVPFFAATIRDLYESKIEDVGGEEGLEDVFTLDDENKSNPSISWIKLKALGESLLNYDNATAEEVAESQDEPKIIQDGQINAAGFDSRYSLAADVLYDKMEELQDWEMLAGYLLYDHSRQEAGSMPATVQEAFKLEEKEDVVLLEMLHAVVKITLERQREDKSHKKKKSVGRGQEDTAQKLAALLSKLLKRFGSSSKTLTAVLRLVQVLDLGVFQQLRQDQTEYAALLHEIKSQFKSHADTRVLKEASIALLHALQYEDLEEPTESALSKAWGDAIDDLRKRYPNTADIAVRGDTNIERLIPLTTTIDRLKYLCRISNPINYLEKVPSKPAKGVRASAMASIDILIEAAGRGYLTTPDDEIDDYEDKLVIEADKAILTYFQWKCVEIKETINKKDFISDQWVEDCKARLDKFRQYLTLTISSRAGHDLLRLEATHCLLDLFTTFSLILASKKGKKAELDGWEEAATLSDTMDPDVVNEILSIFATAEKHFAKKAGKKLEPPADDDDPEDDDDEEDEQDEEVDAATKLTMALKAEHQLCELTSHIVLAIRSGVIYDSENTGKFRQRLVRNRKRLGPNMDRILQAVDATVIGKPKGKKKTPAQQTKERANEETKKSEEVAIESDDEIDNEELNAEEARERELLEEEEGLRSADEADEVEDEDVEMMGD